MAFHGLTGRECSPLHSESPEWFCDKPAHGPADALQSQPAWPGSEVELVPSWSAQAQLRGGVLAETQVCAAIAALSLGQ